MPRWRLGRMHAQQRLNEALRPPGGPAGAIGNVARIAARPQGDVALTVGYSGQRLYRYRDGVWAVGFSSPRASAATATAAIPVLVTTAVGAACASSAASSGTARCQLTGVT